MKLLTISYDENVLNVKLEDLEWDWVKIIPNFLTLNMFSIIIILCVWVLVNKEAVT